MQPIFQVILVVLKAKLTLITLNQSIPILLGDTATNLQGDKFYLEEWEVHLYAIISSPFSHSPSCINLFQVHELMALMMLKYPSFNPTQMVGIVSL